ncbi:MAG: alpha/beta hydrolase [Candidatus Omnitrophica bacterium]|nr:alpha/beta hydrolase [Candidatus Omnitrophota bacterium]
MMERELRSMGESFTTLSVVTTDNQTITFNHYQNGFDRVIILVHGFYNSKQAILFEDMATILSGHFDVIVMDLRGHGGSTGWFTWTAKEYLDIEAVLTYTKRHYEKIGMVGFSLGAAVCLIAASRVSSLQSLISVCSPMSFRHVDFRWWQLGFEENLIYNFFQDGRVGKGVRPGWLWKKKIKPIDIVDRIKIPTLFIHGAKDWLILPWHSLRLYDKACCQKELKIFPQGTHAEFVFRLYREDFTTCLTDWFNKTIPAA